MHDPISEATGSIKQRLSHTTVLLYVFNGLADGLYIYQASTLILQKPDIFID